MDAQERTTMDQDTVTLVLRTVLAVAVPMVALAVGLRSATEEVQWLWARPLLLVRSLGVVMVVVPLSAVVLVKLVELPQPLAAGLLIVAVAVGPVAAQQKSRMYGGQASYALGLNLALLALSVFYVPLAVSVVGVLFSRDLQLDPGTVARVVLPRQLLPLLAGLLVARRYPRGAEHLGHTLNKVANALLAGVVLFLLAVMARPLAALGSMLPVILGFAGFSVAAGHFLAGKGADTRMVLASFAAMRFPPLALLLAGLSQVKQQVLPVVLAYVVASALVLAVYSWVGPRWERWRHRTPEAAGPLKAAPAQP